jgi:hypothetical protein
MFSVDVNGSIFIYAHVGAGMFNVDQSNGRVMLSIDCFFPCDMFLLPKMFFGAVPAVSRW